MNSKTIFSLCMILLLFLNCEKDDNSSEVNIENLKITSFKFLAKDNDELDEDIMAKIDHDIKEIKATLPTHTSLTALVPEIEVSEGASIFPDVKDKRNFSSPITYYVREVSGPKGVEYTVRVSTIPSEESEITDFLFLVGDNPMANLTESVTGTIEGNNIYIDFGSDVDITALIPDIRVSSGAIITPDTNKPQDFTVDVTYEVIAEDKVSKGVYTVHATKQKSSDNLISSFKFANINGKSYTAEIRGEKIILKLPAGTDLSSLTPTIEIDSRATMLPTSGKQLDFNDIVTYEVTAEDGTTRTYAVNIFTQNTLRSDREALEQLYETNLKGGNLYINYLNWDLNAVDMSKWEGVVITNGRVSELTIPPGRLMMYDLSAIGMLSELTYLYVTSTSLEELSGEIGELKKLKTLNLMFNEIKSLPVEIGELESLEELYLSNNELEALPTSLGKLTNLKYLMLDTNNITELPIELANITKLLSFDIKENPITIIPKEICDMGDELFPLIYKDTDDYCEEE